VNNLSMEMDMEDYAEYGEILYIKFTNNAETDPALKAFVKS
jgi:hypothetical protein